MLCRYTTAKYKENDLYFAYTVNAMFQVNEMLEENEKLFSLLNVSNEKEMDRFCKLISILARCGAQVRESEGNPRPMVPEPDDMLSCISPVEFVAIKGAAINAILLGYGREVHDTQEEVDQGLAELEKK